MTISSLIPSSLVARLAEPAGRTREDVARLSLELSSGRKADAGDAVRHDFSALSRAERDLALHDSLRQAVGAGERLLGGAGRALDRIAAEIETLRDTFVPGVAGGTDPDPAVVRAASEAGLREIVAALNVAVDGRTVFAGGRADAAATADADTILADLDAIAAAATDEADLTARVRDYFLDPTGGFQASRVVPGAPGSVSVRTGEASATDWTIGVTDERVLAMLEVVGQAAALTRSPFAGDGTARARYATGFAAPFAAASGEAIGLRAATGRIEGILDRAADALDATRADAMARRDKLIGADPYETATLLEQETARLETVYTLTARLSRLRLTDYL